jgi:hypothetical protein
MKTIFRQISLLIVFISLLAFNACEKEETRIVASEGIAPVLSVSASTLVLDGANAEKDALSFSWSKADYNFDAAVSYSLQLDKKGNNFAAPKEFALEPGTLLKKFTVADLNNAVNLMGLPPGSASQLEARVKASLGTSVTPLYSAPTTVTVTPYLVIINYPSVGVPGGYQGWNAAMAPKLASVKDNKEFEGYVDFNGASDLNFKFNSGDNWYGWASSSNTATTVSGTMNLTGGNLFVPSAGYWLLKANLNNNTWEGTKTTFGVIGDATPGGWNTDTNMSYDATAKVWKATVALAAGGLKFRANSDWAINYGDTKPTATGFLQLNGDNIPVTAAGNYQVVLDLSIPGNYRYTLTKM